MPNICVKIMLQVAYKHLENCETASSFLINDRFLSSALLKSLFDKQ